MTTPLTLQEEKELVFKSQENIEEFGPIYDHYYPLILRFISRRVYDYDTAYDLTSLTFCNALQKLKDFEWRDISISAWLYRIASNEIKKHYRKFSLFKTVDLEAVENYLSDPETADTELKEAQDALERNEEAKVLHKGMMKLKENYHQILVLRYWEKKSIREIASIFGKSENNMKVMVHRATKKLKKILEKSST